MANSQFDERNLSGDNISVQVADGTSVVQTPSYDNNQRYDQVFVSNSDGIPHTYVLLIVNFAGAVTPIASGTLAAASAGLVTVVEALHALLPAGAQYLLLPASYKIGVQLHEAVTGNDLFQLIAMGGSV
jgi:hypothetical protein